MTTYAVSFAETATATDSGPAGSTEIVESAEATGTYTGQTQLTLELATATETFGVPIVTFLETGTVTESYGTLEEWVVLTERAITTDTFDISTSILANPLTFVEQAVATDSNTTQMTYNVVFAEMAVAYDSYYVATLIGYENHDKYYYTPRQ